MPHRPILVTLPVVCLAFVLAAGDARAQRDMAPVNDLPNPYLTDDDWAKLPEGRTIGSTGGIDLDRDGQHVWVAERCGANECTGSDDDPILKFTLDGTLVTSFGAGMMLQPHGLHVDQDGNIWVTDSLGPNGEDARREGKGHAVYKFSPEGELLLTLGTPGIAGKGPDTFDQPCDVVTTDDGTIYVADGHAGQQPNAPPDTNARVVMFAPDGTYLREWGTLGSGPGEFKTPHAIAMDSRGRIVVADRGNDRVQVFDADGTYVEELYQYSRPSGLHIADDDTIYVADSASGRNGQHLGWEFGIRIGNLRDGSVVAHIDDRNPEGVVVTADGTVYSAVVAYGGALLRHEKRSP